MNWLPVTYRFNQFVNSIVCKYFNEQYLIYLSEVFNATTESDIQLRGSFQKLICSFRKNNNGQFALSYIGTTFWKKTRETLKHTNILHTFKHNLEKHFLNESITLFELIFIFSYIHPFFIIVNIHYQYEISTLLSLLCSFFIFYISYLVVTFLNWKINTYY